MRPAIAALAVTAVAAPESPAGGLRAMPSLSPALSITALTREELAQALTSGGSLHGADLSEQSLAAMDFVSRDLQETSWRQADLRGARFTKCDLRGADFSAARLNGAIFQSCRLNGTAFDRARLPGTYFGACDLVGATFAGATVAGVTMENVTISATGAAHLVAVATALELRGGARPAREMLAAASGDAFAFTYRRTDPSGSPGAPLTYNPIMLAFDTLGYDATQRTDIESAEGARKELGGILRRGLVALLPMRLAGGALVGSTVEQPLWIAAQQHAQGAPGTETIEVHTPFGRLQFTMSDLVDRWKGPWSTLLPAGEGQFLATYPICTVGARKADVAPADAVVEILRHASAIMNEPRSFADTWGGFAAYEALIGDIGDAQVPTEQILEWSGRPRVHLAAAREQASDFLRESATRLPEPARPPMERASALYDEVASILRDEWPLPGPEVLESDGAVTATGEATIRRPHAQAALRSALGREREAVALMEQAVAETVRAQ